MLIHRFWSGPGHPHAAWTADALAAFHAEATLVEWDVPSAEQQLGLTLDASDDPRHLSNVVRYAALLVHGGLWVDHDVIPLARLDHPRPYTAAIRWHREGAVMWFPTPGHPMLADLLAVASDPRRRPRPSPRRSGAQVLRQVGRAHPDVEARDLFTVDASGSPISRAPLVHHLWDTSRKRVAA